MLRLASRLVGFALVFSLSAFGQAGPPWVVTTTADSGDGSLRQEILDRNANCSSACTGITFNIAPAECTAGQCVITPLSPLPWLALGGMGGGFSIDGATNPTGNVTIDGNGLSGDGLVLDAMGITVNGLAIVGFGGAGLRVNASASSFTITNSKFGETFGFVAKGNGVGIAIANGVSGDIVGNTVRANLGNGIAIGTTAPTNTAIYGTNSIWGNGGLGIDLGSNGPTANGSGYQNTPVLTSAVCDGGTCMVSGTLTTPVPSQNYQIAVFGNFTADPEGQIALGTTTVTTDAFGVAPFTLTGLSDGPMYDSVTATATLWDTCFGPQETSEFSAPVLFKTIVTNTNESGPGSLRQAIADANSGACARRCSILFSIPTSDPGYDPVAGTFTIRLNSPDLTIVAADVWINGLSQNDYLGYDANPLGPEVVLEGNGATNGLVIDGTTPGNGDNAWINDLVIANFSGSGIVTGGANGPLGVTIADCYVGVDHTGEAPAPNGGIGINVTGVSSHTEINGCVIAASGGAGIRLDSSTSYATLLANYVGTTHGGADVGNNVGLELYSGPNNIGDYWATVGAEPPAIFGDRGRLPASAAARPSAPVEARRTALRAKHAAARAADAGRRRLVARPPRDGIAAGVDWYSNYFANNVYGIVIAGGASYNVITENGIWGNLLAGIQVASDAGIQNTISKNEIHTNGGLGINIDAGIQDASGVTQNDGADGSGPNEGVDYPVITAATTDGAQTTVTFQYTNTPVPPQPPSWTLQFFSSTAADASGFGEGEFYETATTHIGDGSSAQVVFPTAYPHAWITATATSWYGSTSELGAAVQVANLGPTAVADAYITSEDVPLIVPAPGVVGNDTDPDGDTLTSVVLTGPTSGTLVLNADGSFTYTPNPNYAGLDSFTYEASDGYGGLASATVSLTITAVNDPPTALDDAATTDEDVPAMSIPVLANDTDPDGPFLSFTGTPIASNGSVVCTSAWCDYVPNPNFNGIDTFTYTVTDGSASASATVTVTVNPVNDPPVAVNDTATTSEDVAVLIPVVANDTDPDGTTPSVTGTPVAANGTVVCTPTACTYTPNANFNGTDGFTYTVTDGTATATATVSLTITAVNDPPLPVDDAATTSEDAGVTIPVLSNDTDVEGTPLAVSGNTAAANGTVACTSLSCTYTPNANFNGTDSFTYTVTDGSATAIGTVTVTVNPVNDPPVAVDDTATTSEDVAVVIPVLANDTDPDGTTPSVTGTPVAANGTVVCTPTACTYTPNPNFNGTDGFTYTITDGTATASATVTVTVTAVNDAPVANPDAATTPEDTPVTIPVLANDTDDAGPIFLVSHTPATSGTVVCTSADCTFTPAANVNGSASFTYTISDGSLTASATGTITITPVNDPPAPGADITVATVGGAITINVLSNDTDADGDPLTVSAWTNGALGTVSCTPAGACTYTPTGGTGADSFTYTVTDGAGGSATGTVNVTIQPAPCPDPVTALSPAAGASVDQSGTLSWTGGTGADLFRIYLGPAGSGCSTLFGTTTATSLPFTALAPGEYDWKVVAEKSACTTPPQSACIRFTVIDPCPNGSPSLVEPEPNAETTPDVRFVWTAQPRALRYHLLIFSATTGSQELAVIPQPAGPLPPTIATTVNVPLGTFTWRVIADFTDGCPSLSSTDRFLRVVRACPTGVPEPLEPLEQSAIERTPVLFRWSAVPGAVRYELVYSINDAAYASAGTVDGTVAEPSLSADVPAGASLAWYVQAILPEGCGTAQSRTVRVSVSCFPPVLSLQGEVTTEKPYEVRATIVSVGLQYLFEESASASFATVTGAKAGEVDPTGTFVYALFEHSVLEPTPFFYRVRLDQTGCAFSDVGRIVVIPLPPPTTTEAETVVQEGTTEEIRQPLFIPSPTPDRTTTYTYLASTDREWMRVEPAGGVIGKDGVTVTVISNPAGLQVGTNTGTVTLTFIELAGGKSALETTSSTSKPVSVTLVTPVTNKGKDAPSAESLIIPAVAHATGVNSEWQTDLRLLNLGSASLKYALNLTVSGEDGTLSGKSSEITLAAGQNSALNDVVKQWYGLGSLPGEGATGVLEIRPLGAAGPGKGAAAVPVTRSLVSLASSRTYNKTPAGTLGEYIPAIPYASFVGGGTPAEGEKSVLSIQQLSQSSAYRSNLGVVEASGQPVGLEIRFYDADGSKMLTLPLTLKAGEHRQLNQVLAANGLTNVPTARAEIEVVSGEGRIAAYASVVDNVTGDPLQVSAVDLAKIGARKYVMPGIAHFDTGQARWRTDVQVFNAGLASVNAQVDFFPVGASTPSKTASIQIEPGKMRTMSNIVSTLFGESNTGGAIQISTATNSELVVTGRTYDQKEQGSYGQFMAAVTEDDAIGLGDRAMQVLQMEQSSNIRSNLGIVEVSGKEVRVELTAYPSESRVSPKAEFTLRPNEFRQMNAVLKTLNAGTTYNARVGLRVIGGDGKIVAYGSTVDNMTQDPTYVPGQ